MENLICDNPITLHNIAGFHLLPLLWFLPVFFAAFIGVKASKGSLVIWAILMFAGLSHIVFGDKQAAKNLLESQNYTTIVGEVVELKRSWVRHKLLEVDLVIEGYAERDGRIFTVSKDDYFKRNLNVTNMRIWAYGLKVGDRIRFIKTGRIANHRHAVLIQKCGHQF